MIGGYADSDSAQYPTSEKREEANCNESHHSFPFGPIERIIDIVRRLGDKNDISTLLILELMMICESEHGEERLQE